MVVVSSTAVSYRRDPKACKIDRISVIVDYNDTPIDEVQSLIPALTFHHQESKPLTVDMQDTPQRCIIVDNMVTQDLPVGTSNYKVVE
ncbi:hypothetical protein KIN20_028310 [Parelaphostrongylus tenuis]|uniref:Uncharacterized protein n=1 Tax=Parelaphostrongylus tenuis TaxID=148309 RepID=A0AAD5R0Y1_PARTN|nr:hypothetical protein KIN20_028310 [Parelaphostrongylus tenuis]